MYKSAWLVPGLIALLLSACAAPLQPPPASPALPPAYPTALHGESPAAERWWEALHDPVLDGLIRTAQRNNHEVRLALAKVAQARAGVQQTAARSLPGVNVGVDASDSQSGLPEAVRRGQPDTVALRGHADLSWELDLMGALRAAEAGAQADFEAARWSVAGARLLVSIEVARHYLLLQSLARSQAVAEARVQTDVESLRLTASRVREGAAAPLAADRAQSELEATRSGLPDFAAQRAALGDALAVLLGEAPGALLALAPGAASDGAPGAAALGTDSVAKAADLASEATLRRWQLGATGLLADPGDPPVGQPADLLRRRPDIQAAALRQRAESARSQEAHADRFPRFFLSALLGSERLALNGTPYAPAAYSNVALAFALPAFDGGRRVAAEQRQSAVFDEASLRYQQTVLRAVRDVDASLAQLLAQRRRHDALQQALDQALAALARVRALESEGEIDRFGVLALERAALGAEAALLDAERARGLAALDLYAALGGGWSTEGPEAADASTSRESAR